MPCWPQLPLLSVTLHLSLSLVRYQRLVLDGAAQLVAVAGLVLQDA